MLEILLAGLALAQDRAPAPTILDLDSDAHRQVVVDRDSGVKFVPSATRYWWPHTCADAVADWLEELGCDVAWAPARLGLYVARPDS